MTFEMSKTVTRKLAAAHNSVPQERRLALEVLELLWSYHLLQQQKPTSNDPLANMATTTIMKLLLDDVILRLCKFRDTDSRSLSFDQVVKHLRKRPEKRVRTDGLSERIAKYRKLTTNLQNHRDTLIAHLSKRDRTHLRPTTEIPVAIRIAVEICDTLCGERNEYCVVNLDLRAAVLGEDTA